MKYALLFAATAAAYDAYGVPSKPSSTPVYGDYGHVTKVTPSHGKATPCSTTVGKNGYTTVVPGYGKQPVTVTKQHQAYPTCVAKGYDGKSCDKWEDDKYVSTTITDYNKKVVTVTKVQDYVTVYHEKKTITHYATPSAGGYGAYPTGSAKNATGNWYELYEKVYVCKYEDMGKNVLVGYTGSGLCQKCDDEQPIMQKEYKNGKWVEEKKTLNYGKPKEDVKVYEKPGVYTVPGKTVTVYEPKQTGGYEKHVYQHEVKTITITKPGETYTCKYNEAKKTPTKGDEYPPKVTKTPTKGDYDHKATPTPKKPEQDYPDRPHKSYPSKPSSTPCDDDKTKTPIYNKDHPTPTPYKPVYGGDYDHKPSTSVPSKPSTTPYKPVYGDDYKPSHSVPSKPSSTPCDDDKKKPTPTPYKPVYDDHKPTPTPNKPVYDNNNGYGSEYKPTPTPNKPVYDDNNKPSYDSGKPSYDNGKPSYDNDNNKPSYDNSGKPSYDNGKPSYDNNKPSYGAGYSKRSGMKARREAMAAQ